MKRVRGWGSGPAVLQEGCVERMDSAERWQRSIRRAAGLAPGAPTIDASLRALVLGFRQFRRDMQGPLP